MTHPDDDFDLDAFNAAFAEEFGEPLADEPASDEPDSPAPEESEPERKPVIAMLLTPVADAEALARPMGLVKVTWQAATTLEMDDMTGLTGSAPPEAIKVAQALSRTSEFGVVLLTSRVGQGDDGASGQIQAWRYVGGEEVETLSPGVVLAGVEETVEK